MLEVALLCRFDIPVHVGRLFFNGLTEFIVKCDPVHPQQGDLTILHKVYIARVRKERGDIGGNKALRIAMPHDHGTVLRATVDRVGLVAEEDRERKRAFEQAHRSSHGGETVSRV